MVQLDRPIDVFSCVFSSLLLLYIIFLITGALAIAIRQFYLFLEFRQFRFLVRLYEKFLQFVRPLPRPIRLAHDIARAVDV